MELNKIYNESNLDTMARMPDNFIDLTVTSPPYDNLRTYNGYCFDFENVAKELFRVTKQGGVVVWVVSDATINGSETGTSFKQALFFMQCGFNLYDTMIYATNKPPQNSGRYEPEFEYMFVFCKGKPNTFTPIKRKRKWDDKRKEKAYHRATDESVLPSDTTYHSRGKSMQTGLADRDGMHCRKTRTEINADKCRNLLSKSKFLHFL